MCESVWGEVDNNTKASRIRHVYKAIEPWSWSCAAWISCRDYYHSDNSVQSQNKPTIVYFQSAKFQLRAPKLFLKKLEEENLSLSLAIDRESQMVRC